jgi:hypothetical protein
MSMSAKTIVLDDLVRVAYDYFGLPHGDRRLFSAILENLRQLGSATSTETFAPFLADEEHPVCLWRLKWPLIYCLREKHIQALQEGGGFTPEYSSWVDAYGRALVALARLTKNYDPWIQQILNYEDFLFYKLQHTDGGNRSVCDLYDLRGIDFFLVHYMGGPTTAVSNSALFASSRIVPKCLAFTGREEEARVASREIDKRERSLKEILTEYSPPHALSLPATLDCLRLLAERFWVDYLSLSVWGQCSDVSRQDLLDAFIAKYMLQKGVLRGWSQVVLSLCKVIEREMGSVFFAPWVALIQSPSFTPPEGLSSSQAKRVQSRQVTFQVLQACARKPFPSADSRSTAIRCEVLARRCNGSVHGPVAPDARTGGKPRRCVRQQG